MANEEHAVRIQTSLLNGVEKKFLVWMAGKLPKWVTSDMLTWFGVFGSLVVFLGYVLSNLLDNPQWIWLSSLGLVFNWFGDSLDGSIARVRKTQRPLYGFYLDHNIDCVTEFFMFVGIGLSGMVNLWVALLCFIVYLQLEVYVSINAHLKNEFKLTYGKMGPTELRLIIIICNVFLIYTEAMHTELAHQWAIGRLVLAEHVHIMDYIGLGIFAILLVFYLGSFFKDLHYFAKLDPLKKHTDEEKKA